MKYLLLSLQLMVLLNTTYAQQVDTPIFARINEQIQHFVPDTANVPVDSVT